MRTAYASQTFPGSVHDAEAAWYDTDWWSAWVPGLERVERVQAPWPDVGGEVRWHSVPAGRGAVVERVIDFQSRREQTVEVQDDSIRGRQTVTFLAQEEKVEIALRLSYELKQRSPLMGVVDLLFIRRAMARALEEALTRFGVVLEASRQHGVG